MTTVVVVRKGSQVAIAGDSLVTFGDTRLPHGYEANDKLFKVGESWFGMSGTTAHFPVLRRALNSLTVEELRLGSRDEVVEWVRSTFLTDYQRRLPPPVWDRFLARYRELLLPKLPDDRPFLYTYPRVLFWGQLPG